MADDSDRFASEPGAELAARVRAHLVATDEQVQRARRRVAQARAQVRQVDQRLHREAADDPEWIGRAAPDHVSKAMQTRAAAHVRAAHVEGDPAELRDERDWRTRAAVARTFAARARERSEQAREELAHHQAQAAAAKDRADQPQP